MTLDCKNVIEVGEMYRKSTEEAGSTKAIPSSFLLMVPSFQKRYILEEIYRSLIPLLT